MELKMLVGRFFTDDEGQDLIEYALLASAIGLASVATLTALNDAIAGVFGHQANQLEQSGGS